MDALDRAGRRVTSDEVIAAVILRYGTRDLVPPSRLQRVLEPALAAGRVTETQGEHGVFYGLANRPALRVPGLADASDLVKVEEALRRAVRATAGAVDPDTVEAVIDADPDLALASADRAVSYHLHVLARVRRAVTVRPWQSAARPRYYYTTPGGPSSVPEHGVAHMDRRRRAATSLWRAGGERPFTTAALRRFAEGSRRYQIADDPPYAWTNALQALEHTGEYVAIRGGDGRWVRWAPSAAWQALSAEEQGRRLRDEYRSLGSDVEASDETTGAEDDTPRHSVLNAASDGSGDGGRTTARAPASPVMTGDAPGHDVAFVSGNWNIRTVIALARQNAVGQAAPQDAEVIQRRPVSLEQVRAVVDRCPHLLGGAADPKRLLHQASRRRRARGQAAVTRVGVVGRTTYYELEASPSGTAFVDFLQCLREANVEQAEAAVYRLESRVDLSTGGVDPLADGAAQAWATIVRDDAMQRANALEAATAHAAERGALLDSERGDAEARVATLREVAGRAETVRTASCAAQPAAYNFPPDAGAHDSALVSLSDLSWLLIDMADAWAQVVNVAHFDLATPRLLQTRVKHLVPTVRRISVPVRGKTPGRRAEVFLDRPAFAAYAAIRWAGPHWASLAAHGLATLGAVRDPQVFAGILASDADPRHHAGAAAALALLDDPESRGALAGYLLRRAAAEEGGAALTPTGALASAALGLAPKPAGGLAVTLGDDERAALTGISISRCDDYAGRCARLTLAAWDEGWTRERLMKL